MVKLFKPQRLVGMACVTAYASEADAATLEVSPENPCLSCHNPASTHQRWSTDVQTSIGPSIGAGGNMSTSIIDGTDQKATLNLGAQAYIGVNVSITEDARAGTDAMPTIVVSDSTSNSSPDSLGFATASPDNTSTGN